MAMDGLRGYLLLASGLADMSRAKATEAASALLSLSSGLTGGRSSSNVQLQVQDLAEELLAAAAANRRSLIALVRSEVERAVARSPIPPDELDRARAAVAKLSADVEALQAQILTNPAVGEVAAKLGLAGHAVSRPADDGVVVDAAFTSPVDEPVPAAPRRRPPRKQIADRASTRPVATDAGDNGAERPTESAASTEPAVTTTTAAPAKKAATKKAAPAKKAATKKAATKKAATDGGQRRPAKKAADQEGRHEEGCHQEGRHQEGRHQEERYDHNGEAGQEGGEDHDHSGASVRRGDHEEGGRDEVRRQEVRCQEVRRDARYGERRMTAGIDESGEWPQQSVPHTTVEAAPHTGDAQVDAALARLHDSAESGSLDEQAEAGEAAHRALQDRLADLGGD